MEGGKYLSFNMTNMITIWIMAVIGFALFNMAMRMIKPSGDNA